MSEGIRLAMWSGPRNISTALMRAWDSRPDTVVCDEPLYAYYLHATGRDHPGRAEILAHHETDARVVIETLTAPLPADKTIFYQKHMAHHLLPEIDGGWLAALRHGFLIREPRAMLTSLAKVLPSPALEETALPQQVALFDHVRRETGRVPPVLDARDVLEHPRALLEKLCATFEVPFDAAMLTWRPGPRPTDGVWARIWYANVERSTGFQPYRPKTEPLPAHLEPLYAQCRPLYDRLYEHRLKP